MVLFASIKRGILLLLFFILTVNIYSQQFHTFKIIAFYTAKNDEAHISFVHEANNWFLLMGRKYNFIYDSTNKWSNMNDTFLSHYQVIIFLDTRPDSISEREAFRRYMEKGGSWLGFHFSAFALNESEYPENWDWYHNHFIGAGEYKRNTWRPTSAILHIENNKYKITEGLPLKFSSAPNEWYSWKNDLRKDSDIDILVSIDSSSFPLGTGPKPYEIWHNGYYPVVWTNRKFKMVYFNMGHNDMDYEHHTNKQLSSTFSSKYQNQLIVNSILWLKKDYFSRKY